MSTHTTTSHLSLIASLKANQPNAIIGPWIQFFTGFDATGKPSGAGLVTEDLSVVGLPFTNVRLVAGANEVAHCLSWGRN